MSAAASDTTVGVLLIEDDDGDALLVEEMLERSSPALRLARARTLREGFGALVCC